MHPAPAVVIIARHGARLDAADQHWHLSSPTPYDPPLTYGGWTQARALGTRIASILHAREEEQEEKDIAAALKAVNGKLASELNGSGAVPLKSDQGPAPSHKKKRKIVLHTSPFLRCVQTSIGISAGIAQYNGAHNKKLARTPLRPAASTLITPDPDSGENTPIERAHRLIQPGGGVRRPKLRIDAFLGEWLSPDYYELITPPPNSTLMVAGAKADLLRRAEYVEIRQAANLNMGHFPGGWGSSNGNSRLKPTDRDPLARLGSLAKALPLRERSISQGSFGRSASKSPMRSAERSSLAPAARDGGYVAPTPLYAVASPDPIPRGFVAHARDACVDIDLQWDSMREPLNWPDGGEYGEEWSNMHKRFRRGFKDMIAWYEEHGTESQSQECAIWSDDEDDEPDNDDDTELVVVLVTHGAGCNALIGALTNQPVLLDVNMASLTLAVRRDNVVNGLQRTSANDNTRYSTAMDTADLAAMYEMRLVASTDHLRPGTDPAKLDHVPSPKIVPRAGDQGRGHRFTIGHASAGNPTEIPFNIGEPGKQSAMSAALGTVRRTQSGRTTPNSSHHRTFTPPITTTFPSRTSSPGSATSSNGLWSSPMSAKPPETTIEALRPRTADQRLKAATTFETAADGDEHHDEKDTVHPLRPNPPSRNPSGSQAGLWGVNTTSNSLWKAGDVTTRDKGPKRRWTVNERDGLHGE